MRFSEWLYNKGNAPDNDPQVAAKGRFLRMRQEVMDYIDKMNELGIPGLEARERVLAAFKDQMDSLPEEMKIQVEKLIKSFTGILYPER